GEAMSRIRRPDGGETRGLSECQTRRQCHTQGDDDRNHPLQSTSLHSRISMFGKRVAVDSNSALEASEQDRRTVGVGHRDGPDRTHRIHSGRKPRTVGVAQLQGCVSRDEGDHPGGLTVHEYEEGCAIWNVDVNFHRERLLRVARSDLRTSDPFDRVALRGWSQTDTLTAVRG